MTRAPVRDHYDAVVDLFPTTGGAPDFAYALVKFTYSVDQGRLALAPPVPLLHDFRDPSLSPRLPPGSDFWPGKDATDVVVLGSAYAPQGRPVPQKTVAAQVGNVAKRIQVFGQRHVVWRRGKPHFAPPELFEELAIVKENAYGGCDLRVPVDAPANIEEAMQQEYDHPGVYPRNPFGKGYIVLGDPVDGIELPNLEDPADLLTPERLVTRDPRQWWRQPLPWTFDWHHPLMFPRFVYMGADAWFPGPEDETLHEVRRRFLPPNYRRAFIEQFDLRRAAPAPFYQEASLGMSYSGLAPGTRFSVAGMHPEGRILEFSLPPAPNLEIMIERDVQRVVPQLTNVVIEPAEARVSFTWVGRRDHMPRKFIPGIHGKIPLILRVERDVPIAYETPPTIRDQMKATETQSEE